MRDGSIYYVVTISKKIERESLAQARATAKQTPGWCEVVAWDYRVRDGGREHVDHRFVEMYLDGVRAIRAQGVRA